MKVPTEMSCSSGTMRSALGPLAGNSNWSTHLVVYQAPRPQPICSNHGHTAAGGASIVIAWSVWTMAAGIRSSPGSAVSLSAAVDP